MNALDRLADHIEDSYANERDGRRRKRRSPEERRDRHKRDANRFGLTFTGPTINVAELLKDYRGKTIPIGDNTIINVPSLLTWTPTIHADHVRLDFSQSVTIEVDGWIDWHLAWKSLEDWPGHLLCGIEREMLVVDEIKLPKDWSSP